MKHEAQFKMDAERINNDEDFHNAVKLATQYAFEQFHHEIFCKRWIDYGSVNIAFGYIPWENAYKISVTADEWDNFSRKNENIGHWCETLIDNLDGSYTKVIRCSECKTAALSFTHGIPQKTNFCPCCGAKMI